MKKIIFAAVAVLTISASAYLYTQKNNASALNDLGMANVEALANAEQPDVNDCITDYNYNCEALHPTDPSQDIYRENARW